MLFTHRLMGDPQIAEPKKELATFAAGCFWTVELVFQRLPGVLSTQVGYTQGHKANPTYQEVCSGQTGHAEAVLLEYDPEEGGDIGTQYRSGIYYHNKPQKEAAKRTKKIVEKQLRKKVVTEILPTIEFWPAEDYHQRYLEKGGQCAAKRCTDTIRCYG
ncbi:Peptide methionine sulfoxide reductase A4, chloroplastic [Balamuthia mandrillaris]